MRGCIVIGALPHFDDSLPSLIGEEQLRLIRFGLAARDTIQRISDLQEVVRDLEKLALKCLDQQANDKARQIMQVPPPAALLTLNSPTVCEVAAKPHTCPPDPCHAQRHIPNAHHSRQHGRKPQVIHCCISLKQPCPARRVPCCSGKALQELTSYSPERCSSRWAP